MKRGRDVKRGSPHSERAGEAVLATGRRTTLYRALRELTCSPCGNIIREGELFTREAEPASGLLLVRLCRGCAPFTTGGGLLDALLAPGGGEESRPIAAPGDACEKVMSRLGPALAAGSRRRCFMDGGELKDVRPGLTVDIVLKQDQRTERLTRGVVKDVLTKSSFHPHGIKVRLVTGEVGRVKAIIREE